MSDRGTPPKYGPQYLEDRPIRQRTPAQQEFGAEVPRVQRPLAVSEKCGYAPKQILAAPIPPEPTQSSRTLPSSSCRGHLRDASRSSMTVSDAQLRIAG